LLPSGCIFPSWVDTIVTMTQKNYQETIKRAIAQLRLLKPEKIILYGSGATNTFHEGSDVDLLVIKKTKKSFLQRNIEAASCLDIDIAYDIFVVTPEEVKKASVSGDPFLTPILSTGKIIYAR